MTIYPAPKPAKREKQARKPVKRRNAKRQRSEFARAYGSKARVAFVASLPCAVRGRLTGGVQHEGKIENAHVVGDGAGRKASSDNIIPLCAKHHRILHKKGVAEFESLYLIYLPLAAKSTEAMWQAFQRSDAGGER